MATVRNRPFVAAVLALAAFALLVAVTAPRAQAAPIVKPDWIALQPGYPGGPNGAWYEDTAVTPLGGVYAVGQADLTLDGGQAVVTKYAADGTKLWTRGWRPADQYSYAIFRKAGCDVFGDVYAAALAFDGLTGQASAVLAKYAPNGNLLWLHTLALPDGWQPGDIEGLKVTCAGAAYLVADGYSGTSPSQYAWITAKFDSKGNQLWLTTTDLSESSGQPSSLALDASGNAYITGTPGQTYCLTLKFDGSTGAELWREQYLAPGRIQSFADTIVVRGSTVTVVGGSYAGWPDQVQTPFVLRYGTDGTLQWVYAWTAPQGTPAYWRGAVVDATGATYLCGVYSDVGQSNFGVSDNLMAVKLDAAGQVVSTTPITLSSKSQLWLEPVGLDAAGRLTLFGQSGQNLAAVRLSAAGTVSDVGLAGGKKYPYPGVQAGAVCGNSTFVGGFCSDPKTFAQVALIAKFTF